MFIHSINQLVNQPIIQLLIIIQSANHSLKSIAQSTDPLIIQSVNEVSNQSIIYSVNRSINRLLINAYLVS